MWYCILLVLFAPLLAYIIYSFYLPLKIKKIYLMILITIPLCLVAGLRSNTTFNDSASYSKHFYQVKDEGAFYEVRHERMEKGYLIYEKFIHKHVSDKYPALFIITSLITIGVTSFFFYKKSNIFWLSVFFWITQRLYFLEIQAVRQGIAIALFLIAVLCLEKKKFLMVLVCSFLAIAFHQSSVICLLVLPIFIIPLSKRNVSIIAISFIVALMTLNFLIEISGYEDSTYLNDDSYNLGDIISTIVYAIVLLYSWQKLKHDKVSLQSEKIIVWGAIFCILTSITALKITVANRYLLYFEPFAILLFTKAIENSISKKRDVYISCVIGFLLYIGVLILKPGWNKAYPYQFFWESNKYLSNVVYHSKKSAIPINAIPNKVKGNVNYECRDFIYLYREV